MKMRFPKDKTCLQLINMFIHIIYVFYDIFFSVYMYELSGNINFVLGYNLFSCVIYLAFVLIMDKVLNKKNFNIIYRLSFVLTAISIGLIFTIGPNTLYMIFVVQTFYRLAHTFYYCPHEVAIMNYNTKKTMSSYVGISQLLTLFVSICSPFISGYIIDYISYYILFAIIGFFAILCFVLSFGVKRGYVETPKLSYGGYIKEAHKNKRLRLTYLAYGLYKLSQYSAVDVLVSILLFMKVGTNFSVGLYSTLATAVSAVVLMIYMRIKKHRNAVFVGATILIVAVSVMLTAWASLIAFFIYYFVSKSCQKVLKQNYDQSIYTAIECTDVEVFKKQHHAVFNAYDQIFKIFAYAIAFLVYNLIPNIVSLSIIILILTFVQIAATFITIKTENMFQQDIEARNKQQQENNMTNENTTSNEKSVIEENKEAESVAAK